MEYRYTDNTRVPMISSQGVIERAHRILEQKLATQLESTRHSVIKAVAMYRL